MSLTTLLVVHSIHMFLCLVGLGASWAEEMLVVACQMALNKVGYQFTDRFRRLMNYAGDRFVRPAQAAAFYYTTSRPPYNTHSFEHWHFNPKAYNTKGGSVIEKIDEDGLSYSFTYKYPLTVNLYQSGGITRGWPQAQGVKLLLSQIADTLSPLHNIELFSSEFPDGDRSGRDFKVIMNGKSTTLYDAWETGCGLYKDGLNFSDNAVWERIDKLAEELTFDFPAPSSLDFQASHGIANMAKSYEYAKKTVYTGLKNGATLTSDYIKVCQEKTRKDVANVAWAMAGSMKNMKLFDKPETVAKILEAPEAAPQVNGDSETKATIGLTEIIAWVILGIFICLACFLIYKKHFSHSKSI